MPYGLVYVPKFIQDPEEKALLQYLNGITPIWEYRYSRAREIPAGREQRRLLRPIYWLGSWQFACLDYYRFPKYTDNRCVTAEPFPPVLATMVKRIEKMVRQSFNPAHIPKGWNLNTCLINYYGTLKQDGKNEDCARVGEHKDFEPGPVASLSLGERALFQFVKSVSRHQPSEVIHQMWLENRSLQVFAGPKFKDQTFHRVQRVEKKGKYQFPSTYEEFHSRRINFTLRYVPETDVKTFHQLPKIQKEDTVEYLQKLSEHSAFFARQYQS